MGRDRDEITIRTRSLLQTMAFLSGGVAVPTAQRAQAGLPPEGDQGLHAATRARVPFRATSTTERPTDAFVTTRYNGHGYAIDPTDLATQRSFNTSIDPVRLPAPERAASTPLLALPAGP